MLIGELSKRSGLSRDTIRFYEKQGFIKLGRRDRRVNNYKEYPDAILKRLLLFNKIKSYGFTLNESAQIISLLEADLATCDRIAGMADEKVSVIEKKIAELQSLKILIRESIDGCIKGFKTIEDNSNCPLFEIN